MSVFENPVLTCEECGARELAESADGDWQLSNNPRKPVVCDNCLRVQQRAEKNHQLSEVA